MVSTVLKKRFCKDNEYPINIYKDPYFSERLKFFGFYEEWKKYVEYDFFVLKNFIRIIKQVNSEEEAISETDFYAKESIYPSQNKGKVVFKGVNPIVYPIVYGNYFGKPISDSEKVFYHENMIARIIDDVRYEILDSTQTYEKNGGSYI